MALSQTPSTVVLSARAHPLYIAGLSQLALRADLQPPDGEQSYGGQAETGTIPNAFVHCLMSSLHSVKAIQYKEVIHPPLVPDCSRC